MLHSKKVSMSQKVSIRVQLPQNVYNKVVKVESITKLCRVCLKQGTIPIHRDNRREDLTDAITTFGGIAINISDSYPKYLCLTCFSLLRGAILFKQTAQESDERLKKSTEPESVVTQVSNERLKKSTVCKLEDDHLSDSAHDTDTESFVPTKEQKPVIHSVSCEQCDLEFKTFQEYKDHTQTDNHANEKKTCSICTKTYSCVNFKTHMKIHRNETGYICDVCGKHSVLLQTFLSHHATHFYRLPYKCSLCPYKGRLAEALRTHMRSHTGQKPYVCKECPKQFMTNSNLSRHKLTHRSHDFKCECGRGFYTKRDFDLHLKVEHAGMKEHVCPICGTAFGYRKYLMRHQLKVHKRDKLRPGRQPIYLKVESMKHEQQVKMENNMP